MYARKPGNVMTNRHAKAEGPARTAREGKSSPRRSPEEKLAYAVLLSWLIHALLLCLAFGGYGWLPGFSFPWQVRRSAVPELRVLLVPAPITAAEPPVLAQALTPPVSDASVMERLTTKGAQTKPKEEAAPEAAVIPAKDPVASPARADPQSRADTPGDSPPPIPAPDVIASLQKDETTWVINPPAENPTRVIAATPSTSSPEAVTPAAPDPGDAARIESARLAAERVEAARVEALRLEAERQAAARIETARLQTEREESARAEAARAEAARLQAERQESARAEPAQVEPARLQAEREEAARIKAEEAARIKAEEAARIKAQDAARIKTEEAARIKTEEAARIKTEEAARIKAEDAARIKAEEAGRIKAQDAARIKAEDAARIKAEEGARIRAEETARIKAEETARIKAEEAARIKAEQEAAAARREERLRALGRELDEAAARRDAAREARAAANQSPSHKPLRRYRLLGRTDSNSDIIRYAEAFGRKIELNMTIDMVREVAKVRHDDPLVTVAIRSDGYVESVTFIRSSGVAAIDEAIRRIVASQEPYPMFPPALAEYDVIEIRRSWHFDIAVRLY
jgi:TolA protein